MLSHTYRKQPDSASSLMTSREASIYQPMDDDSIDEGMPYKGRDCNINDGDYHIRVGDDYTLHMSRPGGGRLYTVYILPLGDKYTMVKFLQLAEVKFLQRVGDKYTMPNQPCH